ncbi:tail fiber protein [Chromobacterium sphagni]|uniref:tail fiber protein n=1 Tax=Chromobacterium sphagni TaxID=1903179 RepID=UPI001EFBF631|nr:phage tail protein [Chromobacterium sphagni]
MVSADWLNSAQSAIQSTQQELLAVIKNSGQSADPSRSNQLLQAVQNIAWGGAQKPTTLAGYGISDGASKTDLKTAIDDVVAGAPGALNTLQELAAALGNDQNFAASIAKLLAGKADKAATLAGYGIADGATSTQVNAAAPAGMVAYFAMKDAPAGWLVANGGVVARKDYPALFAAIGSLYGNGDGSTTFGLPNLCGEFIRGWDCGRGVDSGRSIGSQQNATAIRVLIDKLSGPTYTNGTSAIGAWNIDADWNNVAMAVEGNKTPTDLNNSIFYVANAAATSGSGDNGAFTTRPRNVALLACIKC